MKHLFSSGEVMYNKNEKQLSEGTLLGTHLEYDEVEPDTKFLCFGTLNGKEVKVSFIISEDDFGDIKSRHNFRILMQSDVLIAKWKNYKITNIK
jgi:hypothetical protein